MAAGLPNRKVLFVPGLSGPYDQHYASTYECLVEAAESRGYSAEIVCFRGQRDRNGDSTGALCLTSAREDLDVLLREAVNEDFTALRIVAFSFGCTVALSAMADPICNTVSEAVLVGPVPFWYSWQVFIGGDGRSGLGSSSRIVEDREYFRDLKPVEPLLKKVVQPVILVAGSEDVYCTPSYLQYLDGFCRDKGKNNVKVQSIRACRHTPAPSSGGWDEFVELALGG